MGEYDRKQRNQLSRIITNSKTGHKQQKGFVDNRINSTSLAIVQRATITGTMALHNFLHYIYKVRRKERWSFPTHLYFNGNKIYAHMNVSTQLIDGGVGNYFTSTNCTYSYDDTTKVLTATNITTGVVTNIYK